MPAAVMVMPNTVMTAMIMARTVTMIMIMNITIRRTTITRRTIIRMIMATVMAIIIITMTNIASMSTITANPMLMTTNKPPAKARRATKKDQIEPPAQVVVIPAEDAGQMTDAEAASLYRLMTWLSPSFPVGAFSYSSGIEWAVEAGDIVDAASLRQWLTAMLADGPGFCDGVFLAQAHRAASSGDHARLREIAELAAAFAPSRERHLETSTQGRAFIEIARSAWNCQGLAPLISACDGTIVYPVAVGIVSAAHAIPPAPAMHAFFHAVVSNWISAGARLVPLGQTDSQRVLAALEPVVVATAARVLGASLDDLGSTTFRADLASLRHETQYTRLFRS
jgi:urease accessory protein